MGILSAVSGFFGGDAGKEVVKGVSSFINNQFPGKLSEGDRLQLEMEITAQMQSYELKAKEVALKQDQEFNQRLKDLEGTAKDLKTIPIMGPIIIFLRGCQRPFWGFGVFYFDFLWFKSSSTFTDQQESALFVINLLVLGFLFGERAVQNVMPLIITYVEKKFGSASNINKE